MDYGHTFCVLPPGGVSAVPGGIIVPPLGAATLPATAPTVFSSNICLDGLFTPNDVQAEGPSFFDEIIEDVRTECSKYGVVLQVSSDGSF